MTCKRNDLIVRTKCRNTQGVEYLNSYRGLNASGFTVEGPWQTRSIVSVAVVSWWMLDLARAAAGDKFTSLLHHLQKCF